MAGAGNKIRNGQGTAGDRPGFVSKKDVEASRCLNSNQFADEDVILEHSFHIGGQNNRNHHWQPFRNGNHNDGDSQSQGVEQMMKQIRQVLHLCRITAPEKPLSSRKVLNRYAPATMMAATYPSLLMTPAK